MKRVEMIGVEGMGEIRAGDCGGGLVRAGGARQGRPKLSLMITAEALPLCWRISARIVRADASASFGNNAA